MPWERWGQLTRSRLRFHVGTAVIPAPHWLTGGGGGWSIRGGAQSRPIFALSRRGQRCCMVITVDAEAQACGVSPTSGDFVQKAVAALNETKHSSRARQLLEREVPDGPGAHTPFEKWQEWAEQNQPYLFFSDTGGYRWYIDPPGKAAESRDSAFARLGPGNNARAILG